MSKRKVSLDILEDPDALAGQLERAEDIFTTYRTPILGVLGGIVLLVAGIVGYRFYQGSQDEEAQTALFPSLYQYEADSTKKALYGDGANPGLIAIADDFGGTKGGNLATIVAGMGLLKQGKYDEAIERLKAFSAPDLLVQGRAYALIGDAYMEKKSYDEAIGYYRKAADYKPSKYFTPAYLMKLGGAYEEAKKNNEAIKAYDEIIEKYADSAQIGDAKKYKSRLEAAGGES
jgi:TolA-binding protein